MQIVKDYYCSGTGFEVINCPAYIHGKCKVEPSTQEILHNCIDVEDCVIKNHCVALSALVNVASRTPRSAEHIGAMACFNSFLIRKPD